MVGSNEVAGTLLVVDDEIEIREIIELSAASLGFRVVTAADGQAAIELVREQHVDVIVSDLMMPRMTGIALLNALRSESFTQPFIFVTAFPSQDSTLQALRLGAFDYVEKPFDPDELETLLKEAMRVSLEMQKLGGKRQGQGTPAAAPGEDRASNEIQKLRTLRFAEEGATDAEDGSRQRLHEMFVTETTPQLLFCDAAIKGLAVVDQRAFELGYLFRVAQGIASAAEAIGEKQVRDLAGAAARYYTVLRVKPRAVTPDAIELAKRANEALRVLVSEVGQAASPSREDAAAVQRALTDAAKQIEDGRQLLAS